MRPGTSVISQMECQSIGEKKRNVRGHWPKVSGFLWGGDSSSLQVIRGERARDHMASLLNTHFRKQPTEGDGVLAPPDDGKIEVSQPLRTNHSSVTRQRSLWRHWDFCKLQSKAFRTVTSDPTTYTLRWPLVSTSSLNLGGNNRAAQQIREAPPLPNKPCL